MITIGLLMGKIYPNGEQATVAGSEVVIDRSRLQEIICIAFDEQNLCGHRSAGGFITWLNAILIKSWT
jgi:hypothetical protein